MEIDISAVDELFHEQRRLLLQFFDSFNIAQLKRFVESIGRCQGTIIFTGVGKSGFICQKISASFTSIGIKSIFLDPLGALHGDLGGIFGDDIIIMFSKSGSTSELVKLVPMLRRRKCKIVSVTCSSTNALSQSSDMHIHLPLEKELCVFNLAPVTSSALQLIFGDTATALLMNHLQLSQEAYAMNHPAGFIGRNLSLNVEDIMIPLRALPRVAVGTRLSQVVITMSSGGVGCVLIIDADDHLKGIFTDGDLRRLICDGSFNLTSTVEQHMMTTVRTVDSGTKLNAAKSKFFSPRPISVLPVIDAQLQIVLGLISLASTIRALE